MPADYRKKAKRCKKLDRCHDLSKEANKLGNIKATVIPIAVGVLGNLQEPGKQTGELEIRGRIETI